MSIIGHLLDDRYQVLEVLASGGFGQTYIAVDTKRPKSPQCVVKKLYPESQDDKTIQIARRLFRKEAEILDILGQHSQIPRLFAYFEVDSEFYLVQELIVGKALSEELMPDCPQSEVTVRDILFEALEILSYVHSQGVIHRDIKPANFLRRASDSKLVLIDFGAVKEVATQLIDSQGNLTATVVIGTPGYMPLEQFHGNPQFNSDIYALGMMAIQALTGMPAADLSSLRDPQNPSAGEILWRDKVTVTREFGDVIDRMVRTNFRERYINAQAALNDLKALLSNDGEAEPPTRIQSAASASAQPAADTRIRSAADTRIQPKTSAPKKLWIRGLLLGGAIALSLGGGAWWLTRHNAAQSEQLYQEALDKYRRDDYRGAVQDLDRAIALDSNNALAYYQRGLARDEEGQTELALADLDRAIELLPKGRTLGGGVGVQFEIDPETQQPRVVTVRERSPAAKASIEPGDTIVAIDGESTTGLSLEQVSERVDGKPGSEITLAMAGKPEQTLVRVASPNFQLGSAYFQRGLIHLKTENYKAANADASNALDIDQENFFYYYIRGTARSRTADKQGAIQDFTQAIALNPQFPVAYQARGRVHRFLQDYSTAIQDFKQASTLNPEDFWTHYELCVTQTLVNENLAALESCNQSLAIDPQSAAAFLARGGVNQSLGNMQAALNDYARTIELDPTAAEPYTNRGLLREKAGDLQGAIADFSKAIQLDPESSEPFNNRGLTRYNLQDYSGALQDFAAAIKNNETNAGAYFNRGLVYLALEKPQEALQDYRKAADLYLAQKQLKAYEKSIEAVRQLESIVNKS